APLSRLHLVAKILPEKKLVARGVQDRARRIGVRDHRGASGAEDAGLLAPDLFARRAQIFDMVDADARQHRAVGIDDVDRVEPAAQPDLEDRRLDLRSRKKPERREGAEFEIRELDIPSRLLYCRERFGQSLVRSLDARYAHALVVAQQVR